MRKFLFLTLLFLSVNNVVAEEATVATMEATIATDENVVTHKIEKKILPLPECDDETLLSKTKEFLTAYFSDTTNEGTMFRRRKHFLLNKLTDFTKENVANYKTAAARPVSDVIIELQMNEKILEENMRLCKKASTSKVLGDIYLLVYPFENGYRAHLLNLDRDAIINEKNTFTY